MKKIIIVITAIVLLSSLYYKKHTFSNVVSVDTEPLTNALEKTKLNKSMFEIEDKHLTDIAYQIKNIEDDILIETWRNEFGCAFKEVCPYEMMTAQSYEEALWMKRKGYLSSSIIDQLEDLSRKDLLTLEKSGNVNAKKLLSISAIRSKNAKLAKSYSRSARAYENGSETFSLRLMAQAYLLDKQPMLATIELRMASLLGDTEAAREYERMTRNSAREFIDNTNMLAFRFLSTKYKNTPINEWDDDPRPTNIGGG